MHGQNFHSGRGVGVVDPEKGNSERYSKWGGGVIKEFFPKPYQCLLKILVDSREGLSPFMAYFFQQFDALYLLEHLRNIIGLAFHTIQHI